MSRGTNYSAQGHRAHSRSSSARARRDLVDRRVGVHHYPRPAPPGASRPAWAFGSAIESLRPRRMLPRPRATPLGNVKDSYADLTEHESLEIVLGGHSAWNVPWIEPQHTGGHERHKTRTESPGGTWEGVHDHEIYRPPEAGAQVRILPGAPRLTCRDRSELPL